jgi:tagatose 6-phosphate kinase
MRLSAQHGGNADRTLKMILCLGTTPVYQRTMVFDRVTSDAVNRAKEVHDYASGKSVNAARVISTLGESVLATGFVGGGRGNALCRDLDAAGIPHDFVTIPTETRQCVTVIDGSAGTATELVEESSPAGAEAWAQLESKLHRILPQSKIWVFSGTLAPDAAPDFYARWIPLARQNGARAIIDVSGEPLQLAMRQGGAILKMNRDELALTVGADLSDERSLTDAMIEHTPPEGAIVVTLGADGAVLCNGGQCWRARSPRVTTVSAVGSGDSFAGGLAAALQQNQSLIEALKLAIACGAANAITPRAGFLDRDVVARLAEMIQVEQLA